MGDAVAWEGLEELRPLLKSLDLVDFDPENANEHDERSIAEKRSSLRQFGQRESLVGQWVDGRIRLRAGEGRVRGAQLEGWSHMAIAACEEDDDTATAYALVSNRAGEHSHLNAERVVAQLAQLEGTFAAEDLGWQPTEVEQVKFAATELTSPADLFKAPEPPPERAQRPKTNDQAKPLRAVSADELDRLEDLTGFRTAQERRKASAPMRWFEAKGLLAGDVLDYGCGRDVHDHARFDPAYAADWELLDREWDTVTLVYVLNVVPLEYLRAEVLLVVRGLLAKNGQVLVAVWKKGSADSRSSKGHQCAWSRTEWERLLRRFFEIERLAATQFLGWRLRRK